MHVYQAINKKLSSKPCTFRDIYKKLLFGAKKFVHFSTIRISASEHRRDLRDSLKLLQYACLSLSSN